jgi:hypothetical protein
MWQNYSPERLLCMIANLAPAQANGIGTRALRKNKKEKPMNNQIAAILVLLVAF